MTVEEAIPQNGLSEFFRAQPHRMPKEVKTIQTSRHFEKIVENARKHNKKCTLREVAQHRRAQKNSERSIGWSPIRFEQNNSDNSKKVWKMYKNATCVSLRIPVQHRRMSMLHRYAQTGAICIFLHGLRYRIRIAPKADVSSKYI